VSVLSAALDVLCFTAFLDGAGRVLAGILHILSRALLSEGVSGRKETREGKGQEGVTEFHITIPAQGVVEADWNTETS